MTGMQSTLSAQSNDTACKLFPQSHWSPLKGHAAPLQLLFGAGQPEKRFLQINLAQLLQQARHRVAMLDAHQNLAEAKKHVDLNHPWKELCTGKLTIKIFFHYEKYCLQLRNLRRHFHIGHDNVSQTRPVASLEIRQSRQFRLADDPAMA